MKSLSIVVALMLGLATAPSAAAAKLMTWEDFLARPRPKPDVRVRYGEDPLQVVELWKPRGVGPFPVVLMLHGGCWNSKIADLTIMNYVAADLRRRGVAVWNVEYRGYDVRGGGYPGTYQDVATAARRLARDAATQRLDLGRLVMLGHSAGGHLAVWLAGKGAIRAGPLAGASGLRPKAVVVLGGVQDLSTSASACGEAATVAMTGHASAQRPDPLADTSGPRLLPLHVPQVVINGDQDDISPPRLGEVWTLEARAAGDRVTRMTPAGGHVEEIAPGSPAWAAAARAVMKALR